jgi:hypothetical protein
MATFCDAVNDDGVEKTRKRASTTGCFHSPIPAGAPSSLAGEGEELRDSDLYTGNTLILLDAGARRNDKPEQSLGGADETPFRRTK